MVKNQRSYKSNTQQSQRPYHIQSYKEGCNRRSDIKEDRQSVLETDATTAIETEFCMAGYL